MILPHGLRRLRLAEERPRENGVNLTPNSVPPAQRSPRKEACYFFKRFVHIRVVIAKELQTV